MGIDTRIQSGDVLGTAVRYDSPKGSRWFSKSSGRKLYIEPEALNYLKKLNTYDQYQVCKEIEALASTPSPMDGFVNKLRPAFFKAKQTASTNLNFIIKYQLTSAVAVVSGISLNYAALGRQTLPKNERSSLYKVSRTGAIGMSENATLKDIDGLKSAWREGPAEIRVKTKHAAVNGMLNNLEKATWLMGAHVDAAFKDDKCNEYTLFHNPSESAGLDFYESVQDNLGLATNNAKQLAAILADVQKNGQSVKWVVHSQGGIIFKQAVSHHLKENPGQLLDKNSVVFHSGGHNKKVADKLIAQAGIRKAAPDRDNPFDVVPNIAGGNQLGLGAIRRSVQFLGKVAGSEKSSPAESPHTLPFFSLQVYHRFLTLAGDLKSAGRVQRHMDSLAKK